MGRRSNIKWREKDSKKIESIVRQFNRKIRKIAKKTPDIASIQPKLASARELKSKLKQYDRNYYNKTVAKMERYLRNGAEMPYTTKEGVNTTLWQKKEIDNAFKSINAQRRKEVEKYNPSIYTGTTGSIEGANLLPRKNTVESIKPRNWEKFVENIENQMLGETAEQRQSKYKKNFLHAVEVTIGKDSRLYKLLESTPMDKLYQYYFTEPLLQISFTSDPKDADEIEQIMLDRLLELNGG